MEGSRVAEQTTLELKSPPRSAEDAPLPMVQFVHTTPGRRRVIFAADAQAAIDQNGDSDGGVGQKLSPLDGTHPTLLMRPLELRQASLGSNKERSGKPPARAHVLSRAAD